MVTSLMEGRAAQVPSQQHMPLDMLNSYRVELAQDLLDEQGQLIDWLIGFAFETLGTRVLDLRVVPPEQIHPTTRYSA
jgi:hypothetical protein